MENVLKDIWPTLILSPISTVIVAVITYFAARWKTRLDLSAEYDRELRTERLTAYKELWKKLKPLARYSREEPITYEIIRDTSQAMRDWYYDAGGIYLSRESRLPYFTLKRSLQRIIDNEALEKDNAELDEKSEELKQIFEQGTELRASLSDDIGTRNRSFF